MKRIATIVGLTLLAGCAQPYYADPFYAQPYYQQPQPYYVPAPQYGAEPRRPLELLPTAPPPPEDRPEATQGDQPLPLMPPPQPEITPAAPPPEESTVTPPVLAPEPQAPPPTPGPVSGGNVPLEGFRPMHSQTRPAP